MPLVGAAAWLGALVGLARPAWWHAVLVGGVVLGLTAAVTRWRRAGSTTAAGPSARRLVAGLLIVASTAATVALVRVERVAHNPVASWAGTRTAAQVELVVTSDPRRVEGRFADQLVMRGRVERVGSGTVAYELAVPVTVVAPYDWSPVRLGERIAFSGRLAPSVRRDVAALLRPLGPAEILRPPAWWWTAAERVRAALRESVGGVPAARRPLVPALVVGDDEGLDPALADDFRTTGLTHLLAVSGTNLTLVLGFVLVVARGLRVRGRGLHAVGLVGVVGFVVLARPEPSVLRAAVMGSVALAGLGSGGSRRGGRSLGVAVTALLLVDPWLAPTPGFALSVLATAGIVFVAPVWRDALAVWLPRWIAEALAVPAAAQLACTPVVASLSGQVSLVAVAANLLAAPAVGPATVLGLAGGLSGLLWPGLGRLLGTLAGWCVAWIVAIARHGSALPVPALSWGTGAGALVLLVGTCLLAVLLAPVLLRRRATTLTCCVLLATVTLVRPPSPGWPPPGWVLAMCDVGQGDALVIHAGDGAGVVVDAGPDPGLVDGCLRRLDIEQVPLLVLTHFHADHVDGLEGVARGRPVGMVQVTSLADPPDAVIAVAAAARRIGAPETVAVFDSTRQVGDVTLQVLWPTPDQPTTGPGDGSTANNGSVVLLAQVRGVRLLLTGDLEPPGQERLARLAPGLQVDVLKVPHHGSRYQDLAFLTSLGARVGLVSVGADNDYGHPSPDTIRVLEETGCAVFRTDRDGDVAVSERDGRLVVDHLS
jgi:competence protein ComEC